MAKLKTDAVTLDDIKEFAESNCDFHFELEVLKRLVDNGCECSHGGTYMDAITGAPREFDIRAHFPTNLPNTRLRLAIECKNLRENFPLAVSCVPRNNDESFHEIVCSLDTSQLIFENDELGVIRHVFPSAAVVRRATSAFYAENDMIGKSCSQVGRRDHDNGITSSDSEIYNKWAQALNSAYDLATLAQGDACVFGVDCMATVVLPILVVPNERLWKIEYDADGNRLGDPTLVKRCSYYVNREISETNIVNGRLVASHLEMVTIDGLFELLSELKTNAENLGCENESLKQELNIIAK